MDQIINLYKNKVLELLEAKRLGYLSEDEAIHSLCDFVNNILDTLDDNSRMDTLNGILEYNTQMKLLRIQLCRP